MAEERGRGRRNRDRDEEQSDIVDKLVGINRVAKTVKGGKNFGFAALVVVGDQKGRAGFGKGKAREVPEAIRKATEEAKRNMVRVPLREGRTLHHDGRGRHGAGKVVLRAAPPGTGVIAGGPMRAVMEVLGVQDVVGKSIGQIDLPPGTTIGAIVRDDEVLIAHDSTVIESDDHVILFVIDKKYIRDVERLFQVGLTFF